MSWKPSTYLAGTPTLPASVEVASTATTIAGPFDVVGGTYAEVALTNTDGSQTLNAWVESSPDGTTWNAKLNWQGLGSTAVSLATADAIAASPTSAPRRIPIGSQGFPLVAPRGPAQIGDCAENISVSFVGAPLVVESGRFFHVILQVPVGTATATQIFRGTVTVAGRYEQ